MTQQQAAMPTLDLDTRRAMLREAVKGEDPSDYSGFAAALDGASEADRAALAKTLPPSRLMKAEGATLRACFVLIALGKPKLAAETLAPIDTRIKKSRAPMQDAMFPPSLAAAIERDAAWQREFVDLLAEARWSVPQLAWQLCSTLVHRHQATVESTTYLECFLTEMADREGSGHEEHGARIAKRLREEPELLEQDFWALFRVEGLGAYYFLADERLAPSWHAAIRLLCGTEPGFRDRVLDESLGALLRDFTAKNIVWYHQLHRSLDPTPAEVAARAGTYLAVLATTPSTAVGLAQDMLLRAAKTGLLDTDAVIEASGAVLARTEKKLVKAQLALLAALRADERQQQAISDLVGGVIDTLAPDLARIAAKLVLTTGRPDAVAEPVTAGEPVAVSEPRRIPLAHGLPTGDLEPLTGDEFLTLAAEHLEGMGDGADIPRLLAHLATHPKLSVPEALRDRAAEVVATVWDDGNASPRRHLAATLCHRDGTRKTDQAVPLPEFRGWRRYVFVGENEAPPVGVEVEEHESISQHYDADSGEWREFERSTYRTGYQFFPSDAPTALLAETLRKVALGRRHGKALRLPESLPRIEQEWERVHRTPGEGKFGSELDVLGGKGPRILWAATAFTPPQDEFARRALNVEPVAEEFSFRAQEARDQDGYEQIVQWAAWLLHENPDTLAAQFHPALYAATQVVNVRGVGALLAALGETAYPPAGPVYSALALGCSAKEAPHRAVAAEAIAALAASGLLDPDAFAVELAAHLGAGFVQAGRLAQTLADAASINAIAGYRVLQTLARLLPDLDGVNQAGKLVELTARLADDYGTPVELPDVLAAKRKGSSILALALRRLDAVVPRPTPLAKEAAEAAAQVNNAVQANNAAQANDAPPNQEDSQ